MKNLFKSDMLTPMWTMRLILTYKTLAYLSKSLLVFLILLLSLSVRSFGQLPLIDCNNQINCSNPDEWTTVQGAMHTFNNCSLTVDFRYTKCCQSECEYIIDILNVKASLGCIDEESTLMNEAIKISMVKLDELVSLPWAPNLFNIWVKSYSCYIVNVIGNLKLISPCVEGCCITKINMRKELDGFKNPIRLQDIQPTICSGGCQSFDCVETHFMPSEINFSDYNDESQCAQQCFWRLEGNSEITDQNFIGPTNGEDFVIKTLNTEWPALRGDTLMDRIHIDKNRRIDFNINTTKNLPQISFDSDPWGENGVAFPYWGDPMIKLYRATGTDEPLAPGAIDVPPYKSFPWWITISGIPGEQIPYHHQGSFNIWSCSEEPKVGEENDLMTKKFTILRNGNVGIGILNPEHKLVVNGNILATSIKATGNIVSGETICAKEVNIVENPACQWPDYVFKNDYKLLSFDELEKSISENGSLPGVPNADDVKSNGIELGRMQAILLQKVEELTLYVIQLNKDNQELLKRNQELDRQINAIKSGKSK